MTVELSVVAPVYNEAAVVVQLVERCGKAAAATGVAFEVVIVDDASSDATPGLLAHQAACMPWLQVVRLPANCGQYGATVHGLRAARGRAIAVLDGDLQDPPEALIALLYTMASTSQIDVVFGVKAERHDGWVMRGAAFALGLVQRTLAPYAPPSGAGSFLVMTAAVRDRVVALPIRQANLAAVVASLRVRSATAPYVKEARREGESRVGTWGLVREAIGSLAVTGALRRLMALVAVIAGLAAACWWTCCR
jgi:dolichol-phosphate mannosyltransferase